MANISKDFAGLAAHTIRRDAKLKRVQSRYEEMSRLQYRLPPPLLDFEWMRPVTTASPYLALKGATNALSNLKDSLEIHPISVLAALQRLGFLGDDESKAAAILANQWETALRWQLQRSGKRGHSFASDAVWSVSVYDEVVGQLIHLPTEFKAKPIGRRQKPALHFGDWSLRIVDPKSVYVTYSDYMVESVLSVNLKTAQQLVDFHGKEATGFIAREIKSDGEGADEPYIEFDRVDHEGRVIWASKGTNIENTIGEVILPHQPWLKDEDGKQVPFLNWIASAGGTTVDQAPEFQRKPLLFPVLMTEAWAVANISGTLMMSAQLAQMAGDATDVFTGPGSDAIEEDWTTPRRRLNLSIGQTYQRLESQGLNQGLREIFDRLEGAIQKATVAEVLLTAQPISGEQAFASYDLQVRQALASLGGIKSVSERFFEQVFERMLLITHYTGGEISGYGAGMAKYTIDSEDINPEAIYLSVELKPDVPADRLQRATAAVQIVDKIPYSPKRLLQMLGETDPEGSLREYKLWRLEMADFEAKLEKLQKELSGEYEQAVLEAAQALHQQMMAEIEAGGPSGPGPAPEGGGNGRVPENVLGGEGFNPATGGLPPAMASPGGTTLEGATGMTRGGGETGVLPGG